ncbi:hypothetical protein P409_05350 [Inquilinus limosus MP06]|uniref:Uncharacterized protein n=1 Tax=Inquilinus limosus MP06 TaxID=1398085 RepID=A0A0A0DB16_9PROT|nr:hypothetical protein P409_05350 [Inquilinus limosus MP06]
MRRCARRVITTPACGARTGTPPPSSPGRTRIVASRSPASTRSPGLRAKEIAPPAGALTISTQSSGTAGPDQPASGPASPATTPRPARKRNSPSASDSAKPASTSAMPRSSTVDTARPARSPLRSQGARQASSKAPPPSPSHSSTVSARIAAARSVMAGHSAVGM